MNIIFTFVVIHFLGCDGGSGPDSSEKQIEFSKSEKGYWIQMSSEWNCPSLLDKNSLCMDIDDVLNSCADRATFFARCTLTLKKNACIDSIIHTLKNKCSKGVSFFHNQICEPGELSKVCVDAHRLLVSDCKNNHDKEIVKMITKTMNLFIDKCKKSDSEKCLLAFETRSRCRNIFEFNFNELIRYSKLINTSKSWGSTWLILKKEGADASLLKNIGKKACCGESEFVKCGEILKYYGANSKDKRFCKNEI